MGYASNTGSHTLSNAALQTADARRSRMEQVRNVYAERRRDRFYLAPTQQSCGAVFVSDAEASQMASSPAPAVPSGSAGFMPPQPIVPPGASPLTPFSTLGQSSAAASADATTGSSAAAPDATPRAPAAAAAPTVASGSALPFAAPPTPARPVRGGGAGPIVNDGGSGDPALDEVHARLMSLGLQSTFDPADEPGAAVAGQAGGAGAGAGAVSLGAAVGATAGAGVMGGMAGASDAAAAAGAGAAGSEEAASTVNGGGQQNDPSSGAVMGKHVVQIQNSNAPGVSTIDLSDPVSFVYRPVPKNATVQCYIVRSKGSITNMFHSRYATRRHAQDYIAIHLLLNLTQLMFNEKERPCSYFIFCCSPRVVYNSAQLRVLFAGGRHVHARLPQADIVQDPAVPVHDGAQDIRQALSALHRQAAVEFHGHRVHGLRLRPQPYQDGAPCTPPHAGAGLYVFLTTSSAVTMFLSTLPLRFACI